MDSINILCSTDNDYVPYCGIMLTSLFENNKDCQIHVYLMTEELSTDNNSVLKRLALKYNQDISIIIVDGENLNNCPIRIGDHVSLATYYRLLAPILIPQNVDKILYLDCDIIVNGSIKELHDIDITEYALGAVMDEAYFKIEKYERLYYDKKFSYHNAGVLLMNLNYWRRNGITQKCLEYISRYPERVKFHDQDTINAVLHKEIKLFPIKYNLQTGFLLTVFSKHFEKDMAKILEAAKEPVIIHYTGYSKPWHKGSKHPYTKRFLYYKSISIWKDFPLTKNRTSIYNRFIQIRNEIIWFLGIKKKPKSYIIDKQPLQKH